MFALLFVYCSLVFSSFTLVGLVVTCCFDVIAFVWYLVFDVILVVGLVFDCVDC